MSDEPANPINMTTNTTPNNWAGLSYSMGFAVGGTPIPNPMTYSGKQSDLDTMGERDATGYLHRNKVATKYPLKLSYKNIPWDVLMSICSLMQSDKFQFTYPSPYTGSLQTMDAYVGDRDFEAVWSPDSGLWLANLEFSIIEY